MRMCPARERGSIVGPIWYRRGSDGGDEGTRTLNPRLAKAVRYQLRHVPGAATRYRRGRRLRRAAGRPSGQSSLRATAFGVTFIFGSYSATSTIAGLVDERRPQVVAARRARPVEALVDVAAAPGAGHVHRRSVPARRR